MNELRFRPLGALFASTVTAFAISACSLASGVSDLQGGTRGGSDASSPSFDASTGSVDGGGTSTPDVGVAQPEAAAPIDTGAPPGDGQTCGATRCNIGDNCCVDLQTRSATCANGNGCGGGTMTFECSQPSDCTNHDLCCWSPIDNGSICTRKCDGPASKVLCNPNDADACPDGMSCVNDAVLAPYMTCR